MIRIVYNPTTGQAIPDGKVCDEYSTIKDLILLGEDFLVDYSTANIFSRIRAGIAEDDISHEDIQFEFNYKIVTVNEYGAIHNWPKGFCHLDGVLAERILRAAMKKHKAKR